MAKQANSAEHRQQARHKRLEQALRENLKRRKAQARARAGKASPAGGPMPPAENKRPEE